MIHSSAIEGHHFLISRRKGYDPAEVDAVIKRLVDTLRKYEEQAAEVSVDTAGRAVADLEVIRPTADEDTVSAEELEAEARRRLNEAERIAAALVVAAEEESDRIRELARADAGSLLSRRNARAEELITSALSEVKALRARVLHETNEYRAGKRTEATALTRTAELQAAQMLEDARHEAGSILGRARREHTVLEQRIGQLRSAIAGIEGQFRNLAETTLEQTEIMSTMLSLETESLEEVIEPGNDQPEVVRLTQGGLTVDLTEGSEVEGSQVEGSEVEASPAEASPAEAVSHPKHAEGDQHFVVAPGNTIYQRRGGGLRRRLAEENVKELPD